MSPTKVARKSPTIFKLIGPCEILSHGQKARVQNSECNGSWKGIERNGII